ncbi:MAG: AAA family ATPase [Rhodococcus sp. (in: high G+C Gram-positive bacteria)]|jgi:AAA+ superfamily predicted ATPase|uniref:AAA family ATPase n=1 Tax=Rhodococcus sp. KRD162 TaxID=2729725 RepID=UPI0019D2CDF7|nr:AAA family ATPase [Rhodococcus sp. KRD162]
MTASTAAAADLLTRADRALDDLVGRESIKSAVHKICHTAEHRAPGVAQPGHLVFTGPLGTGKSAVAQIIADIYAGTGIITSPTVHSVSDRDLAGRYWDDPLAQLHKAVDSALGGILYVDEASRLSVGATGVVDPSGPDVIAALLDAMDTHAGNLIVILAGYGDEIETFLAGNERLAAQFPTSLDFESYNAYDIAEITAVIAARAGIRLTAKARAAIRVAVQVKIDHSLPRKYPIIDRFANARLSHQIYVQAKERRTQRLAEMKPDDITSADTRTLDVADVQAATTRILAKLH